MYKNILVPIAFDEGHNHARPLEVAKTLLEPGGKITLLHAVETVPDYALQYLPPDMLKKTRTDSGTTLEKLAADLPNADVAVADGKPGRVIAAWADTHDNDLVVMESHRPVMSDVIFGSNAAYVVRHAKCGVHILR